MDLLRQHNEARQGLLDYFGYAEGWVVLPVEDCTTYHWFIRGSEERGVVMSCLPEDLAGLCMSDALVADIYTLKEHSKWVYRKDDYTLILTNPHMEGNRFLSIFDNSKEVKRSEILATAVGFTVTALDRVYQYHCGKIHFPDLLHDAHVGILNLEAINVDLAVEVMQEANISTDLQFKWPDGSRLLVGDQIRVLR